MKIDKMFPSKYARGEDLAGKPVTLAIARVTAERMRPNPASPETEKYVVYFDGAHRGVVMGRVLAEQIAKAVGSDDTDHWTGKRVTLYPENIMVAGVPRVAIRARTANGNGNGEVIK